MQLRAPARALRFLQSGVLATASKRHLEVSPSLSTLSSDSSDTDAGTLLTPEQQETNKNKEELKRALVKESLKQGTLGLSFCAGGFLYCYHLGVLWELAKLGILPPPDDPKAFKLAGSSAGSLAIATYACGLDVDKATKALFEFAHDCRQNGTQGRLGLLLRDFLHAYLPDDAHERCRDMTHVYVTRVFPVWRPEVVHRFHDKSDLIEALVTSCHIPMYANGHWMTKFRGRYYMDGGVGAFIPDVPGVQTSVKVCCFPVSEMLSKVQPSLEGYPKVSSLLDVSIAPDKFEAWDHTYKQLLQWALVPAPEDELLYLINKGRRDAHAWATSLELVESPVGAGGARKVVVEDPTRGVEMEADGRVVSAQAEGSTRVAEGPSVVLSEAGAGRGVEPGGGQ